MTRLTLSPPKQLLSLPYPWNDLRIAPADSIQPSIEQYACACDVLRRCLQALTVINYGDETKLPEDLQAYGGLFHDGITRVLPTFDSFEFEPFRDYLTRKHPGSSKEAVTILAARWIDSMTRRRVRQALSWLGKQMSKTPHQPTIDAMCDIAEKYWQVDEQIRYPLFLKCARLDPSRARTLFQQILSQPNIDRELREVLEDRLMIMQLRADERQAEAALPAEASGVVTDTSSAATHQVRTKKQLGLRAAGESETNLVPNSEEVDSAQPTKTVSPKIPKKTP